MNKRSRFILLLTFTFAFHCSVSAHENLVNTIKAIKPSIVGIGIFNPTASPQNQLHGSGFVIGDGSFVVTNYHVVKPNQLLVEKQRRVIFSGNGKRNKMHDISIVAFSEAHDLAVLKLKGSPLPGLTLASKYFQDEGSMIAFTGFPIGAILGLYPATHIGIISAVSPIVIPANNAKQLSTAQIKALKNPFMVYQLDATAYPGNSGSPLYLQETGEVIGIINKVFVKSTKESALSDPSGITYAIPVKYLRELLSKENISL